MKQTTIEALLRAYIKLQDCSDELYSSSQEALNNNDLLDADFLQGQADKIFEQAENLESLISELEEQQ